MYLACVQISGGGLHNIPNNLYKVQTVRAQCLLFSDFGIFTILSLVAH